MSLPAVEKFLWDVLVQLNTLELHLSMGYSWHVQWSCILLILLSDLVLLDDPYENSERMIKEFQGESKGWSEDEYEENKDDV